MRDVTVEKAIERLEGALARVNAVAVRREGATLQFRGGIFRLVSSWNVLVPISTGVLEVSPSADGISVKYRVTFTQLLVVVTLMVATFFGPLVMTSPDVSLAGGLAVLAFFWMWLFGGNFVVTRWRMPAFLVRALSHAAE